MSDATITHSDGTISTLLADYTAARAARTVRHEILGSEADDYTMRPFGLRTGEFTLVFPTSADADAAFAVLSTPQTFTLVSAARPGVDMSFMLADGDTAELRPAQTGETTIRVPYHEVSP